MIDSKKIEKILRSILNVPDKSNKILFLFNGELEVLREEWLNNGAKTMASQIRKTFETGLGVFANEIDENGNEIQSDANWILEKFRELDRWKVEVDRKMMSN